MVSPFSCLYGPLSQDAVSCISNTNRVQCNPVLIGMKECRAYLLIGHRSMIQMHVSFKEWNGTSEWFGLWVYVWLGSGELSAKHDQCVKRFANPCVRVSHAWNLLTRSGNNFRCWVIVACATCRAIIVLKHLSNMFIFPDFTPHL